VADHGARWRLLDPGVDLDAQLWRAVDVFRVAALLYAGALHAVAHDKYRYPWPAWGVLAILGLWTAFLASRRERRVWMVVADLALAAAAILATRLFDEPARIADGAQTLPSIYPAAAVLAWAVWAGWRGGLFAAVVVSVADLAEVGRFTHWTANTTANNIVLLVLAGLVVGYAAEVVRAGRAAMAAAIAERAATAERERLARDIHDSVLQVLGFVHRTGSERDPAGSADPDLPALAGEVEIRLRSLISTGPGPVAGRGEADLRAALSAHASARVAVAGPAEPVLLPAAEVAALTAATGAALDNVRRHAGATARAWVLLEDEPGQVTVTVRDDGPGIPAGRLESARAEGRLGVSASIRGRVEELGGTVEIVAAPGEGTEVEIRLPRRAPAASLAGRSWRGAPGVGR
jgi:signal transduction histidine kinase